MVGEPTLQCDLNFLTANAASIEAIFWASIHPVCIIALHVVIIIILESPCDYSETGWVSSMLRLCFLCFFHWAGHLSKWWISLLAELLPPMLCPSQFETGAFFLHPRKHAYSVFKKCVQNLKFCSAPPPAELPTEVCAHCSDSAFLGRWRFTLRFYPAGQLGCRKMYPHRFSQVTDS